MYCSKCGSTIAETVAVCPVCGQPQGAGLPLAPPPPLVQRAGPCVVTPHWQPAPVVAYAGFWFRFLAWFLDRLILGVPAGIIFVIFFLSSGIGGFLRDIPNPPSDPGEAIAHVLNSLVIVGNVIFFATFRLLKWLYFAGFECSSWQATPGKKVLNIVVTDMGGERITFLRATGRHFAKWINVLILGIGYVLAGLTERKQALHDMIAGTLVLRR